MNRRLFKHKSNKSATATTANDLYFAVLLLKYGWKSSAMPLVFLSSPRGKNHSYPLNTNFYAVNENGGSPLAHWK